MALPADYISGTITLTNGSPDFTGTGTGWQAADFREGDILLGVEDHAGQVYVIAAITGNAAGTLTQEWAGTSGTYTYRMRYEWDSSRVSAQARAMVELLGNGNLEAFASLSGLGVPVFTGPPGATTLGLMPVQTDATDFATADRLVRVDGALHASLSRFGSNFSSPTAGRNIDNEPAGSAALYNVANPGTFPPGSTFWWIETQRTWTGSHRFQIAHKYSGTSAPVPEIWYRLSNDTGWSSWMNVTPLSGANSNGTFVRLGDGTQMCWGSVNFTGSGGVTVNATWTYPAAFAQAPYADFRIAGAPAVGSRERTYWGNAPGLSSAIFSMSMNAAFPAINENAVCFAIGKAA